MYVLAALDDSGCYLHYLDCDGVFDSEFIDCALSFCSRSELDAFLAYLNFVLGMDYSCCYKIVEI